MRLGRAALAEQAFATVQKHRVVVTGVFRAEFSPACPPDMLTQSQGTICLVRAPLVGMGRLTGRPPTIGEGPPPLAESNPFRLKTTFIEHPMSGCFGENKTLRALNPRGVGFTWGR